MKKNRVLILGGGFGGIYAALEFERRREPDFDVTLVSHDNFFLFTPMLHEVAFWRQFLRIPRLVALEDDLSTEAPTNREEG
jgi:2-polyprenyl-6-methoxyphenol hydroxylase-like FAD-dependent oxidoreductase